jgi:hypothetical protein
MARPCPPPGVRFESDDTRRDDRTGIAKGIFNRLALSRTLLFDRTRAASRCTTERTTTEEPHGPSVVVLC